jgi:hypothetical protein
MMGPLMPGLMAHVNSAMTHFGVGYPNICLLLFGLTCSSLPCSYFALLKPGLNSEPPSFVCLEIAMVFFGFRFRVMKLSMPPT